MSMTSSGGHEWLLTAVGVALGVIGLAVALWALFWDRSRGSKRCPKCWYDMSAAPGLCCSECGHTVRNDKGLCRTRRRWRWTALGAVLFLGCYVVTSQRVRDRGWIALVPTSALIFTMPKLENSNEKLYDELIGRMDADELWQWQWGWLLERCVGEDPPWKLTISTRDSWPSGSDVWFSVEWSRRSTKVSWLNNATITAAVRPRATPNELRPIPEKDSAAALRRGDSGINPWTELFRVDPPHDEPLTLRCDVEFSVRRTPWSIPRFGPISGLILQMNKSLIVSRPRVTKPLGDPPIATCRASASTSLATVGSTDDLIESVTSPVLDDLVARSIVLRALPQGLYLHLEQGSFDGLEDLRLGLVIEVLLQEKVIATGATIIDPRVWMGGSARVPITHYERVLELLQPGEENLTVNIRGDAAVALAEPSSQRCWTGSCSLPLRWEQRTDLQLAYWAVESARPLSPANDPWSR